MCKVNRMNVLSSEKNHDHMFNHIIRFFEDQDKKVMLRFKNIPNLFSINKKIVSHE